jgi:hypothetical protein
MRHPFANVETRFLGVLTLRLCALLVFATALMMFLDVPLQGDASPRGIVSFQLAGTPHQALRILLEWRSRGALGYGRLSLIADFVYLVIYAAFFSALALWVGARLSEVKWSLRAAWAATIAAVLDVFENGVLLYELNRLTSPSPYPQLAAALAIGKFLLLAGSAAYGLIGSLVVLARRQRRPL